MLFCDFDNADLRVLAQGAANIRRTDLVKVIHSVLSWNPEQEMVSHQYFLGGREVL